MAEIASRPLTQGLSWSRYDIGHLCVWVEFLAFLWFLFLFFCVYRRVSRSRLDTGVLLDARGNTNRVQAEVAVVEVYGLGCPLRSIVVEWGTEMLGEPAHMRLHDILVVL